MGRPHRIVWAVERVAAFAESYRMQLEKAGRNPAVHQRSIEVEGHTIFVCVVLCDADVASSPTPPTLRATP